jgi:hypothetical protein
MQNTKKTYTGDQHDEIERLMDDAERLIKHPETRKEGMDYLKLAEVRTKRETNRMLYARMTGQMPMIPPLEPAVSRPLLKE